MNAIFRTRHIFVTVAHMIRSIVLLIFWFSIFTCLQIAFPRRLGPGPELTFTPALAPLLTVTAAACLLVVLGLDVVPVISSVVIQTGRRP